MGGGHIRGKDSSKILPKSDVPASIEQQIRPVFDKYECKTNSVDNGRICFDWFWKKGMIALRKLSECKMEFQV